jgi:tRNA 2-selenouridine synthase
VPEALILRMRASPVIELEASREARTAFLLQDYEHLCHTDGPLIPQIQRLTALHGHQQVETWLDLARAGHWTDLVASLLSQHYDPAYDRSMARNFSQRAQGPRITLDALQPEGLRAAAQAVLDLEATAPGPTLPPIAPDGAQPSDAS